jgi:hypothetical protein
MLPPMRLFLVFALTLSLFAVSDSSRAQGERPFIDLDDDGTTDFSLKKTPAIGNEDVMSFEVLIIPKKNNQVAARKSEDPNFGTKERFVAAFKKGNTIGKALPDTLEWASKAPPMVYDFVSDQSVPWRGPWPSEAPQYLGLKLVKDGNPYYGWAHLRLDRKYEWALSIRDKAYNPRPGRPIRAGHGR